MTHSFPICSRSVFAAGILLLSLTSANAQQNATFTGTVLDGSGKPLQSVDVIIRNESGARIAKSTDSDGHFSATDLALGVYRLDFSATGFTPASRTGQKLAAGETKDMSLSLSVANVSQSVDVEGGPESIASQLSPITASLEQHSPHSIIGQSTIENFNSPIADFTSILQMAPGTFSVSPNGTGLGQSNTYFRGFSDGSYTIQFDGIPFEDTNSPTHHSWAFFPAQWLGGVDFDRSPGTASSIGPTNFGGTIDLLSRKLSDSLIVRGSVSYGSWDTRLLDLSLDSGAFGPGQKSSLFMDVHQLLSDGYQTDNKQKRDAGSLKYQYKITPQTVATAYVGIIDLWTNTPNFNGPTRAQAAQFGDNFLLNGNPASPLYYGYNYYHVQTDFAYLGLHSDLGSGWSLDNKAYQYRYWNKQNYNGATAITATSAVDKLNGYNKFGDTLAVSKESQYGTFRTGVWYEWAYTDRYQYPTSPLTGIDTPLGNFHEHFLTQTTQPYAEYMWRATRKLTVTAGIKFADYHMHLNQFADNGKIVGNLGGLAFISNTARYTSFLPSLDGNYRLTDNWSAYAQVARGSVIPPSSVFDVKGGIVGTVPKPTDVLTYQVGSVWKSHRLSLDFAAYHSHFQNAYSSSPDPVSGEPVYYLTPDSVTKGIEGEGNIYITRGLSLYLNATAGTAKYVGSELWVQNAPRNTESLGFTYQRRNWDLGFFDKRIGQMYIDNGGTHQAVSINPFAVANLYVNYTVKNLSHLRDSKIRLSFNNLLNNQSLVGVTPASTTTAIPAPGDYLTFLPGRGITVSFTAAWAPKQ